VRPSSGQFTKGTLCGKNEAKARTDNKNSGPMGVIVLCSGTGTYMKHGGKIKEAAQFRFGMHRRWKDAGENYDEAIERVQIKPKIQKERQ